MIHDNNAVILTNENQIYQIPLQYRDYICLTSDKKLYYNETYLTHPYVLNKIAFFKEANLFNGNPIPISSTEMRTLYDVNNKKLLDHSKLQQEVSELFNLASKQNASDLHIIVRKNECLIKLRSMGDLELLHEYTSTHGHALCKTIFMTMCDQAGTSFQPKSRQDARMKGVYLPDGITGVRIGTSPTDSGYIMVCRLLKKSDAKKTTLDNLGYSSIQIKQLDYAKSKKNGINIFAGPTGSGKSTTMSMIIGDIISDSNGRKHIITVENPVEYEIGGLVSVRRNFNNKIQEKTLINYATQTPIMASNNKRKKEMFTEAITAIMRLDPDVVMIGEIRDGGSLQAAIDASMTGHQVWTSVHANSAIGIIKRLITLGKEDNATDRDLICDADIISSLISQRLVKTMCSYCCIPLLQQGGVDIDSQLEFQLHNDGIVARLFKIFGNDVYKIKIRNKNGCKNCYNGNTGRTVIAEIINTDQKFMELMLNSVSMATEYWHNSLNGINLMMHGLFKVYHGIICPYDLEDELEFINIPDNIDLKIMFKNLKN